MTALWVYNGIYKGGSNFFLLGGGGSQLLKRGSKEGRMNSYLLLYYTQGRIQDFLIGGEPNNLGYRGRGTNERRELRAKRV